MRKELLLQCLPACVKLGIVTEALAEGCDTLVKGEAHLVPGSAFNLVEKHAKTAEELVEDLVVDGLRDPPRKTRANWLVRLLQLRELELCPAL